MTTTTNTSAADLAARYNRAYRRVQLGRRLTLAQLDAAEATMEHCLEQLNAAGFTLRSPAARTPFGEATVLELVTL